MGTFFASPERSTREELADEIHCLTNNPLVDGLMRAANSLFTILNEHRQIIAINESFLAMMGVEDAASILGLRSGEYVHCVHSSETSDGCGTSSFCSTCGAVLANLVAQDLHEPVEKMCAITVERDNKEVELFFQVRCCPVEIEGRRFVLMFLQDVSMQQQCVNLERAFFHDISNVLMALMGKSNQLSKVGDHPQILEVQKLVSRLVQEFSVQKSLTNSLSYTYQPLYREISINSVLKSLEELYRNSPLVGTKRLQFAMAAGATLVSDECLVRRIVENMISNALEASGEHDSVKVYVEPGGGSLSVCVWNRQAIPGEIARRIFQRNFTTKQGLGHGLGTYSMKFFGEQVLGGVVGFDTSDEEGTVFRLTLMQ